MPYNERVHLAISRRASSNTSTLIFLRFYECQIAEITHPIVRRRLNLLPFYRRAIQVRVEKDYNFSLFFLTN